MNPPNSLSYRAAGVDIEAGNALVERIKPLARATHGPEVMGGLGGFGALFDLSNSGLSEPVLVSGTDGVGTKLKLAQQLERHDTVGVDLVAMCVNDVLCQGAKPLFFLDYFACGKLDVDVAASVVAGIAEGCGQAGCALIGGETAEMPGMYAPGEYELAGFCVGVVEKSRLLDGSRVKAGDALIGIASSGPHSNGYSLIRKILNSDDATADAALHDTLMAPTRIYVKPVLALLESCPVAALAHVTGGGLLENVIRVIPDALGITLQRDAWPQPEVFEWLARQGNVALEEMLRTFNCGIGMVAVVDASQADRVTQRLADENLPAWTIGEVVNVAANDSRVSVV